MAGMEKVRVGIVGTGGMCNSVHLPSLKDMDDVEVVALCDLVKDRLRKTAEKFGVEKTYQSYHEMFAEEKLDAVFCLVEPSNLYHIILAGLNAGYHTFTEKPPGITRFQAEGIMRKSEETGKMVMVGFNRRYIPLVREIKKRFDQVTRVTQVEGCFYKFGTGSFDKGGLPAFESDTIHAVDLVRWMAGGIPVEAKTMTASYDEPFPNAWNSVTKFDNGAIGIIKANYRTGGRVHRFEIHGPGLSAYINLGMGGPQCQGILLKHDGSQQYSLSAGAAGGESDTCLDGTALAGSDQFYRYYGFYYEDRHFIDCVKNGTKPETSIEDAVKSFRYVDLILQGAG